MILLSTGRGWYLTVNGESLEQRTDNHEAGSEHDAPSATPSIVDEGDEREANT
jgi:hypothetical protein